MDLTRKSTQVEIKNDKSMRLENITIPKKNIKSAMYQSSDDESMSPKRGKKIMLRDVKAKSSVENPIDMSGISASLEKETVEEKMSNMQIPSKMNIYGGIDVSRVELTNIKGNTEFDEAVKNPEGLHVIWK
eukprot:15349915-Ditylum_brightwellii.AAC.1